MNDLWMIGFTGAAVGAAVGYPMVRDRNLRVLGALLLLGGVSAGIIAARHGEILPSNIENLGDHLTYAGNLVFWATLVVWARSRMGRSTLPRVVALIYAVPMTAYVAYAAQSGHPPRFLWLLPLGTVASTYLLTMWIRTRDERGVGLQADLLARMVLMGVSLNLAQAIRTFFPDVLAVREIVPITMTASFLSIAALAVRHMLNAGTPSAATAQPRYTKSALDARSATRLLEALDHGMAKDRWYRDSSLSLTQLATHLQTRPHLLSQALNQVKGQTFSDYVQTCRVAEARRLLADSASDVYTIDALAEAAGFASRSAFYKAFKTREGMTPTEFRARNRARADAM